MELLILSLVLVLISVAALSIRLIFAKDKTFHGGSCRSHGEGLKDKGISCGCGGGSCATDA